MSVAKTPQRFSSCARQTEIQRSQVEGSDEEVRNPPGDVSLN